MHRFIFAIILHQQAQTQLQAHSLSWSCPIRSTHSSASTHSDFPAEQNIQDDLTKILAGIHTSDAAGETVSVQVDSNRRKKAGKRLLHAQKQMFWKRATERFHSSNNANNIYRQISRILYKWVLFTFARRYSLPFIYFHAKHACHLFQDKGEPPQYRQSS